MLDVVESDWIESDGYGLGIEAVSSLMGISKSPLGTLWRHVGLGLNHTIVALATRDGRQRSVVMVDQGMIDEPTWRAVAEAVWAGFDA